MGAQQKADSVIGELLVFWAEIPPLAKTLSSLAVIQQRQSDRLVVREGVHYHRAFHLDGGKEVIQVLLAVAIESQVFTQLHQQPQSSQFSRLANPGLHQTAVKTELIITPFSLQNSMWQCMRNVPYQDENEDQNYVYIFYTYSGACSFRDEIFNINNFMYVCKYAFVYLFPVIQYLLQIFYRCGFLQSSIKIWQAITFHLHQNIMQKFFSILYQTLC